MNTIKYILLTFFVLPLLFIVATTLSAGAGDSPVHWEYEGELGPDHWDKLILEKWRCKIGDMQSPIGISVTEKTKLDDVVFRYYPTPLKIINNGHTIQVNYRNGSFISIGNKKYEFLQFHFHSPSEHKINGKSYDMEVHFVHKGEDGKLAVVAVLLEEGKGNDFIKTLWNNLPKEEGKERSVTDVKINANELLPKNTAYYNYFGSLTVPPCNEIVNWFVLKTPIEVSKTQIDKFTSIFKKSTRPIQSLHGRVVKESN
ncbi:MAG: carbonic anhydrase family protein [Candidatus Brocadia sp.]|nr:carbonic anhydrase family protein [Candidatus Brocadia sp.]